ncbi:hypothetical protein [Mycolicibacterium elephantis]
MPTDPIVLSVAEFFHLEGLENGNFPVTVEVRDQLAELLRSGNSGPQIDALFRAIMTTVASLELSVMKASNASREIYARLLDLETRLLEAGFRIGPPAYPERVEF